MSRDTSTPKLLNYFLNFPNDFCPEFLQVLNFLFPNLYYYHLGLVSPEAGPETKLLLEVVYVEAEE